VTITNDLECLDQWDAGGQHGGKLASENGYIARDDFSAARKESLTLFLDAGRHDALATQVGAHLRFVLREALALNFLTVLATAVLAIILVR
jgi:hypothetical protein